MPASIPATLLIQTAFIGDATLATALVGTWRNTGFVAALDAPTGLLRTIYHGR
jgi:hypothetical protein